MFQGCLSAAAQGYGYPQGEAVAADGGRVLGELRDAPEAVADRVRVNEQEAGRRLQRGALFQVGAERVEQGVPAAHQGLVDVCDQRFPGVGVAV